MSQTTFTVKREELTIIVERVFDAPREKVFKVFTDPTNLPKWWGPRNLTTTVESMDVRVGGKWRFIQRDEKGNEFAFNGVYKEVTPPERISNTFEFEPMAGHILVETAVFEDLGDKTKVTSTARYANLEDLDGMVASGMEGGAVESWERLAEFITTVA